MNLKILIQVIFLAFPLMLFGQNEQVELMVQSISFDSSVTDNTDVFTNVEEEKLRSRIEEIKNQTAIEFAVCSVETIGQQNLHQVATTALDVWEIGKKRKNGILFLIVSGERRVYIATGKGLRKYLKDEDVKLALEMEVVPNLRTGDYYRGVQLGIDTIAKNLEGTPITAKRYFFAPDRLLKAVPLFIVLCTILFVFFALSKATKKRA